MTNLSETVADLRRLLEAATPGPWEIAGGPLINAMDAHPGTGWSSCTDSVVYAVHRHANGYESRWVMSHGCKTADAALIAAAVNALPALLDALDQQTADAELGRALREVRKRYIAALLDLLGKEVTSE